MKKKSKLFYLFLAPAVIVFLVFMIWPICYNLWLSFYKWNMVSKKSFVGFNNYVALFSDATFGKAIKNSIIYVIILMITCFAFPYVISYIMTHVIRKGLPVYRSLLFFPSLISLAVGSTIFIWLFNAVSGPINDLLVHLGLEAPNWFSTAGYVIFVMAMVTTWKSFGYNLIVFLAAVVEVPVELIEAARLENAGRWKIFFRIIVPLTSATAFYVFIITFVFGLQYVFTPIHMITKGGPYNESTNIVYVIYQYAFGFFQSGKAAAVAIISVIVFFSLVFVYKRIEKKVHYDN